ncbi:unnamed protein product [Ascophyllum nodosum]
MSYSSYETVERRRRRAYETAAPPLRPYTSPAAPPWYRLAAGVGVVFISCYASPSFLSSFTGKTLLFFARCLAYDDDNSVARCFRKAFEASMTAASPALPPSGGREYSYDYSRQERALYRPTPQHSTLLRERRTFRSSDTPEHHYSSDGTQMAPAAAAAKERRAEAQHHARLRSTKLHESQHFCKAGDQDRADKLAAEAKRHGDFMQEASRKAAGAILLPQHPERTGVLDVRGLNAAEAAVVVRDFLLKQSEIRRFAQVEIVMGTGIYREPSESTLKATIERLITKLDFPFHRSTDNDDAIIVEMLASDQFF